MIMSKVYTYYRVSTDKQDYTNQKMGVDNFCKSRNFIVDKEYIDDGISGTVSYKKRQLGRLVAKLQPNDIIITSEISRLGRKILDIMELLKILMEKQVKLYTVKENYELGDNIQSKVLAFAFGLSAEIERQLISQRTKEALARKKAEGTILGRPKNSHNKVYKADKYKDIIKDSITNKISYKKCIKNNNLPLTRGAFFYYKRLIKLGIR